MRFSTLSSSLSGAVSSAVSRSTHPLTTAWEGTTTRRLARSLSLSRPTAGAFKVNNFEKWILVRYHPEKKYASLAELEGVRISETDVVRAKGYFRMYLASYIMAGTLFCCLLIILWGKQVPEEEKMSHINRKRHEKWTAELKEQEEKRGK